MITNANAVATVGVALAFAFVLATLFSLALDAAATRLRGRRPLAITAVAALAATLPVVVYLACVR